MQQKLVTLINRDRQIVGQADIYAAHRHPAQYHLASSVWLVRGEGEGREVLLQKRSETKIVGANQWGNAICGNVRPGEDQLGCAQRRLREEIGVEGVKLEPVYQFEYQVYSNETYGEHELDQVYVGSFVGECQLNPEEVQAITWVNLAEVLAAVQAKNIIAAEATLGLTTLELKDLTPAISLHLQGADYVVAPWTLLMLADPRLIRALRSFS